MKPRSRAENQSERRFLGGRHFAWRGARRAGVLASAVLLAGLVASLIAGVLWRSTVDQREAQSFKTAAANVSGRLEILLRRDTDFVRTVRAIFATQPNISPSNFAQWSALLEEGEHENGAYGALIIKSVPASELSGFLSRRNADPAFRALVGEHIEPVEAPAGKTSCLIAAGSTPLAASPLLDSAIQGNWCNPQSLIGGYSQSGTTRAQFTRRVTESGAYAVYIVPALGSSASLAIEVPVYGRGLPTASPAERRRAAIGWVLGAFEIEHLLRQGLGAHGHLGLTLAHQNPGLQLETIGAVRSTSGGAFVQRATLSLDGTWVITVTGAAPATGPSATAQGAVVFLAGLLATLLLVALVLVLARSRQRALDMVREKTGQLEHQALHDDLTGLPNRVLALDRADQMLARARREQRPIAALYVDVDDFKHVNDSLGHAAGDELLREIARCLRSSVRDGETAARLGGDEFVVLVEHTALQDQPERLAERLTKALRGTQATAPGTDRRLAVTASVGMACGLPQDIDELLREADIALYEAKASGKNRYALYAQGMQMDHDRVPVRGRSNAEGAAANGDSDERSGAVTLVQGRPDSRPMHSRDIG